MHRRTNNLGVLGVKKSTPQGPQLVKLTIEMPSSGNPFSISAALKSAMIAGGSLIAISAGSSQVYSQLTLPVPPPGGSPTLSRSLGQAPGLESFAVAPQTPVELVDAIDYLVRVGREDQALPLARKLLDPMPDKEALLDVRNRFGSGKLIGLQNTRDPRLKQLLVQFANEVAKAARAESTDTERIARLIGLLSASKEEAELARERLARVGSHAVWPLIEAYLEADAELKPKIQSAIDTLQVSALPALVGAMQHPDPGVQAVVASAVGQIGDVSALPWLAYYTQTPGAVGQSARQAWNRITGNQPLDNPVSVLTSAAARYLDGDAYITADKIEFWIWDSSDSVLKPMIVDRSVAEGAVGYRLCRLALELAPEDLTAQSIAISTLLQEESDRLGPEFPAKDPAGIWSMAKACGPDTLSAVLKRALKTGKHERVAELAIKALAEVVTSEDLTVIGSRSHVLVEALNASSRRVQFEAAQTLVNLKPHGGFPGSSRVIPILARFVQASSQIPRAVIIHDNLVEGGEWMTFLRHAGYDPILELSGREGFSEAARRGDAELVLLSTTLDPYGWGLHETVSNFKADARTAGIPLLIAGPLTAKMRLNTLLNNHSGLGFIVSPANQQIADRQIAFQLNQIGAKPLSPSERLDFSNRATAMLASLVSNQKKNAGIASMVSTLEPQLITTLKFQPEAKPAQVDSKVNRDDLSGQVLQDSLPPEDRAKAAMALVFDIQRNGTLLPDKTVKQLQSLYLSIENDGNAVLRDAVATLVGVNKPQLKTVAENLTKFAPKPEMYEAKP